MVRVTRLGYPPAEAWKMTPRQLHATLFIAERQQRAEHRSLLALHAMAARGKPNEIKELIEDDQ